MKRSGPLEDDTEDYFVKRVAECGGFVRKMKWIGHNGAADRFAAFPWNRIYLVELKRPKGGDIRKHQEMDARDLLKVGVKKEFLTTRHEVDAWLRKIGVA